LVSNQDPLLIFRTNSRKILTIRVESVKINRVVTMNGQKKFGLENSSLKKGKFAVFVTVLLLSKTHIVYYQYYR